MPRKKKAKKGKGKQPVSVFTGAKAIRDRKARQKKAMDQMFGGDQPPGKR